ncbi:hypothetical protein NDU88_002016, partial [Pleurodeles waltl]
VLLPRILCKPQNLAKKHMFLTFLWQKVLESERSHEFPSTQRSPTSPDKDDTSLVWVGLAPVTGNAPKRNVDTAKLVKENR